MHNQITCKNEHCNGTDFETVGTVGSEPVEVDLECVKCGTVHTLNLFGGV